MRLVVESRVHENFPQVAHYLEMRHPRDVAVADLAIHINHGYASWSGASTLLLANALAKVLLVRGLSFVITLHDSAGHGFTHAFPKSATPNYDAYIDEAFSMRTSASSGTQIFHKRDAKKRIVVGFSMGSVVACLMAIEHPPDFLVLISPALFCDAQGPVTRSLSVDPRSFVLASASNVLSVFLAVLLARQTRDRGAVFFRATFFPFCATRIALWYDVIRTHSINPSRVDVAQVCNDVFPILYLGGRAAHNVALFNRHVFRLFESELGDGQPICEAVGSSEVPTLIVHGADDDVIPFENSERIARRLPGATLERITDCRHLLENKVDDVARLIMRSFERSQKEGES